MSDNGHSPFADEHDSYKVDDNALTSWETATLAGRHLWVKETRNVNLARFEPKLTIGDFTADSDNLISSWIQRDWTGGILYGELNEGSDTERYRIGNAETIYPRQLAQNLETTEYRIDALDPDILSATPVADFGAGTDDRFYAAFDLHLCRHNPATNSYEEVGTLAGIPTGKGVTYLDKLYIPLGGAGYQCWDGATLTDGIAGITPLEFAEWDDKLVCLEHDGQLNIFDGVAWLADLAWLAKLKLHPQRRPRHVVNWWNPQREPTIFVITDQDVWSYDPVAQLLYRTGLRYPRHPDQGLAAATWRDDALYVSVGVGLHQMNTGQVISAVGLDSGDGLPAALRGRIVDLEPAYNGMIAVLEGLSDVVQDQGEVRTLEETAIFDHSIVALGRRIAKSALYQYTGTGWHPIWEADTVRGVPTRAYVSQAHDDFWLWWGYGGRMYRQQLRRTFHNSRQGLVAGIDRFAPASYLLSGRFDAQMSGFRKLASHFEVLMAKESRGRCAVSFQTEGRDWTYLGAADTPGRWYFPFDPDTDGRFAEGIGFDWIEFRYDLSSGAVTDSALVDAFILHFVKLPKTSYSWNFLIRFTDDDPGPFAIGPQDGFTWLNGLADSEEFITFKHRKETKRVRVAQVTSDQRVGRDLRNTCQVSLIEVAVPADHHG